MTDKPLLGEILVKEKLVSQKTIDQALRIQVGGNRRLGHILVKMKAITEDQLVDVLSHQLNTPIIKIGEEFSVEAGKTIPRYLCRHYSILPLSIETNNVLRIAMVDPADNAAIDDLEKYTGMAIEPCLAHQSDIANETAKRIKLGPKDFFHSRINTLANRIIAIVALCCVLSLSLYTYNYTKTIFQGKVSVSDDLIMYYNHDLTIAVDKIGKYSLQGHGAFADGLYKVEFPNINTIEAFIQKRDRDFSKTQKDWMKWALQQAQLNKPKPLISNN